MIMPQKIILRTLQASEFLSPDSGLITNAIVSANELLDRRSLRFGLAPNLRVASKQTAVIKGILSRIEQEKQIHIDSPIKLSCRSSRILDSNAVELVVDPAIDGVMDGGHRCRAFEIASLQGVDLDGVTAQIQIFSGLDRHDLRQAAIHSNTSRPVSARSRQYFSGSFDGIIGKIDMSKYPACFWRDGEEPDGTGIFSQGTHIAVILEWLDLKHYDRHGILDKSPHSRVKGKIGNEQRSSTLKNVEKICHLFDDAFGMEKNVILKLSQDKLFLSTFARSPGRVFSFPLVLLDGTKIPFRLPAAIAGPVIFPTRKMLDRQNQWQYPTRLWMSQWVSFAIPAYSKALKKITDSTGEGTALNAILAMSPRIWAEMDVQFGKFRDKFNFADKY